VPGDLPISVDTKGLGRVAEAMERTFKHVYEPFHVRQMAKAEADAALTKVEGDAVLARAVARLQHFEYRRQKQLDAIKAGAVALEEGASAEKVDEDWVWSFIRHAQDVGVPEAQAIWSKVLAGEIARPGRFAPKTLMVLAQLGREDIDAFTRFLSFTWEVLDSGIHFPVHKSNDLMKAADVYPLTLMHLQDLGLVGREVALKGIEEGEREFRYFGRRYLVKQPGAVSGQLLTQAGSELRPLAKPVPNEAYRDLVLNSLGATQGMVRELPDTGPE